MRNEGKRVVIERLGKYQILGSLSSGPGSLYRVKGSDAALYAMKAVPTATLSTELRERFVRESNIGSRLEHPNLVKVLEFGEADGYLFQVMELLTGQDLSRVISLPEPLPWDQRLSIMTQICDGLNFAHRMRLVHRDIKPSNLFLESSGRARVLDFGMVKTSDSNLTQAGLSVGTLNYMAPEQIRSEPVTAATDQFAVATVFYQLATGAHPFSGKGKSLPEVLQAIMGQEPPPMSSLAPDAPEGLEEVLNRALNKVPASRWPSAFDLKSALLTCKIRATQPIDPGRTRLMESATVRRSPRTENIAPLPIEPAPPPPKIEKRFCPQCTHASPVTANACSACGAPLVNTLADTRAASNKTSLSTYLLFGVLGVIILLLLILVLTLAQRN